MAVAHIESWTLRATQAKTTENQNNLELPQILPSPWGTDAGSIFSEPLGAWRWLWLFLLLPTAAFALLLALKEQWDLSSCHLQHSLGRRTGGEGKGQHTRSALCSWLLSTISQGLCLTSWPWNYKCQGEWFLLMLQKSKNKDQSVHAEQISEKPCIMALLRFPLGHQLCLVWTPALPGPHPDHGTHQKCLAVSVLQLQHKLPQAQPAEPPSLWAPTNWGVSPYSSPPWFIPAKWKLL